MSEPESLRADEIFAGDYRVVAPLAAGGMGAVYQVEQLSTGKQRALKLMRPQLALDEKMRQRFLREARVGARIESEHVVEVIGAGVDGASGIPWLAMELLNGETLGDRLVKHGPMSFRETAQVISELCHAVGAAHAAGIVHRDLKPENLFLAVPRREGAPFVLKVLDFGIAKLVAEAEARETGAVGTPLWMAPEQAQTGSDVSPASDVWAIGLIAFWLLTGDVYWNSARDEDATPLKILWEVVNGPLEPASRRAAQWGAAGWLPEGFDGWFAKCVVRAPSERFADARAARAAFESLRAAAPSSSFRPSSVRREIEETVASPGSGEVGSPSRGAPSLDFTLDRGPRAINATPSSARDRSIELEAPRAESASLVPNMTLSAAASHIAPSRRTTARTVPVERPTSGGWSVRTVALVIVALLALLFVAQKVFLTGF
jgi:serine/threonine protein kinase